MFHVSDITSCCRKLFKVGCERGRKCCAMDRLLNYNPPAVGTTVMKGCNIKETNNLMALSETLTNMHSTCILRFELGLERKIRAEFALLSATYRRAGMARSFRRNGSNEQDYWN
jgi:hypothetical protein